MADNMGLLAMVSSLAIILIGLPAQIWKNYSGKSTEGLSLLLIASACWSYCVWALYGFYKGDLYIFVAQAPGFVFGIILLAQIYYYRQTSAVVVDPHRYCACYSCRNLRSLKKPYGMFYTGER